MLPSYSPGNLVTLKSRLFGEMRRDFFEPTRPMNKQQLISTLKALDALDSEQKAYLIGLVNTQKKYGLVWEDKPEDVEELLRQHLPVLTEVPERRIRAVAGRKEEGGTQERGNKSTRTDQAVLDFESPANPFDSSTL